MSSPLDDLLAELRACRVCRDAPTRGPALAHEPRPIVQASATARLCIASQAPGIRAHEAGVPFRDPSGVRLRAWLGIGEDVFYDAGRVAIVPMGHCFPGWDAQGGDLPPRRECAPIWRKRVFENLPALELVLVIGSHAQGWHLPQARRDGMTATVACFREILAEERRPRVLPLPHPSWRNNAWLARNPWFEEALLPVLRAEVSTILGIRESRGEDAA
ncbi:uracil-DNA glycosylase family protein [Salinarimonas sp.]|uniref:uracil-DNA glycosylase family protein n=1 Tax=Salinarimonas sp. TaxID=2766526 RepID=UPI0039193B70